MKPFAHLDIEWLATELHLVDEFDEEWDSTSIILDFGAAWAYIALRFKQRDGKIRTDAVCSRGRDNRTNGYSEIEEIAEELDGLVYPDSPGVNEKILSDIRGELKKHAFDVKPALDTQVATALLEQRHNKETDREEWALVSKKKANSGGHKVLYWFGTRKPSGDAVKKQEQRIQYFKHKNAAATQT